MIAWLTELAAAALRAAHRLRYAEEWLSLLAELPTGRARARPVLSILRSAPRQAWTLSHPQEPVFEPGNLIDRKLYEAAQARDPDEFLRVLLAANVLVPIPIDAPLEVTPKERAFRRWEAALRGDSTVQVFTSLVLLREALPGARYMYADFRDLIRTWPNERWEMRLNPGTPIGALLRGNQVRKLAEWTTRTGLKRRRSVG